MGLFDRFKKKEEMQGKRVAPAAASSSAKKEKESAKATVKSETSATATPKAETKAPVQKTPPRKVAIASRILQSPVITEKSAHLQASGQYAFYVAPSATKNEVTKAVEEMYGIKPVAVNVVRMKGKSRRFGRHTGMTVARKKAIVTLPKGQSIELFESTS